MMARIGAKRTSISRDESPRSSTSTPGTVDREASLNPQGSAKSDTRRSSASSPANTDPAPRPFRRGALPDVSYLRKKIARPPASDRYSMMPTPPPTVPSDTNECETEMQKFQRLMNIPGDHQDDDDEIIQSVEMDLLDHLAETLNANDGSLNPSRASPGSAPSNHASPYFSSSAKLPAKNCSTRSSTRPSLATMVGRSSPFIRSDSDKTFHTARGNLLNPLATNRSGFTPSQSSFECKGKKQEASFLLPPERPSRRTSSQNVRDPGVATQDSGPSKLDPIGKKPWRLTLVEKRRNTHSACIADQPCRHPECGNLSSRDNTAGYFFTVSGKARCMTIGDADSVLQQANCHWASTFHCVWQEYVDFKRRQGQELKYAKAGYLLENFPSELQKAAWEYCPHGDLMAVVLDDD